MNQLVTKVIRLTVIMISQLSDDRCSSFVFKLLISYVTIDSARINASIMIPEFTTKSGVLNIFIYAVDKPRNYKESLLIIQSLPHG